VGWFLKHPEKVKAVSLFRINSSEIDLRAMETHMSLGNYLYLETVTDAYLVANYMKRLLT
jgi:hypothetical protein